MAQTTSGLLDSALRAAKAGLPVMPLHSAKPNGSCTCGKANCPSPGKHPRTRSGLDDATTELKKVKAWWKKWPSANVAVVGGSNLCLDIDVREADGRESLEELIEDNGPLPHTAIAETGEYDGVRGLHYYFTVPEDRPVRARTGVRPGVDIRAARSYWVLPPSTHASGVEYEWLEGTLELEDRAEAPEWLLDLCSADVPAETAYEPVPGFRMAKEKRDFLAGRHEVPVGEQRLYLVETARSLWRMGYSVGAAAEALWSGEEGDGGICASDWGDVPWTEEDCYEIAADVYSKAPSSKLDTDFETDLTRLDGDLGNGQRLVESFGEGWIFHVEPWDKFFIWDPERERFKTDTGYLLKKQIEEVIIPALKEEAATAKSSDRIKYLWKHALDSQKRQKVDNAIYFAPQFCRREPGEVDADPFRLGVVNGVVDLRTGELESNSPELLLTKRARAEYDPDAKSKQFDRFLRQIIPDRETRAYIQKALGYSLTGSVREHKFFYVYGRPGSGKGTLVDTFAYLMGSYAQNADPETFMLKRQATSGNPTADLARLDGSRFVLSSEPEKGSQFASAQLARLTGGDAITARFLHQNPFEFYPQFKLWMTANFPPKVGSTRSGVWRRMKVIEIDQEIKKPDSSLRDVTMRQPEVLAAMLAWAVEGAVTWCEQNLKTGTPLEDAPEVAEATHDLYEEEDQLGRFLEDVIAERTGHGSGCPRVSKKLFYSIYEDWAREQGIKFPLKKKTFGTELKREKDFVGRSMPWDQSGSRPECWLGLELREPYKTLVEKARRGGKRKRRS